MIKGSLEMSFLIELQCQISQKKKDTLITNVAQVKQYRRYIIYILQSSVSIIDFFASS